MALKNLQLREIWTLKRIKELAARVDGEERVIYGTTTCWWYIGSPLYERSGLPCGPRGEMLLETNNILDFIAKAEENPEHYGKHGLRAFAAAYHGNVVTKDRLLPTSLEGWEQYNQLIDGLEGAKSDG